MLAEEEAYYQLDVMGESAVAAPHPQSTGPDLFLQAGFLALCDVVLD